MEFEIQRSSVDPFAQYDVDSKIFHGRVEEFLDRLGQSVDLVDEQDRASLQVRQVGQDFFRGFETRSAGHFDMDAELLGDAHGKRRLAKSWWSVEQDVPEGVLAFIGRIDGDFQNLHDFSLADHFADPLGPQDRVVFGAGRAEPEGFARVDFT